MSKIQAVVLAAGKGTRMNQGKPSAIPKVLFPIAGQSMISFILKTLSSIGIGKPILVIGYKAELVKRQLGKTYQYIIQKKRQGTGQAAKLAVPHIANTFSDVLILHGDDSAFYRPETLENMIKTHQKEKALLTFLTTRIPGVKDLGRVLRNNHGQIIGVVEKENMTQEQMKLKEINCGVYLVNLVWAKKNLAKIKKHYKGGKEYPLPDIIKIALAQKQKVIGLVIDPAEWVGINLPEQLRKADSLMKKKEH